ncbi:hypothetical protein CVT24_009982 [Panaeolus cyanescens]|uniref:Peptidase S9 prolyl oligopeptidase catalytic domain-containing protein n=1 Tax=Panaeolus cyanescens TaxID=181874 RepID=A0A409VXH4_9AGAR|nr:hypothetical protein CVT24_009982 [Panaeolus cyanescens]
MLGFLVFILSVTQVALSFYQEPLIMSESWRIDVSSTWDVLGPFPIHAREQHFLSPSYPLDLSQQINYTQSWPSSYARDGLVTWSSTSSDELGNIQLSFPDIPWTYLRASHGWAALQHHAVLRTTLTIYPPGNPGSTLECPQLLVRLKQASYFALKPQSQDNHTNLFVPEWYPGNIYDLERALPYLLPLSDKVSLTQPTSFDLFVSGDYEIRLFGDPLVDGSSIPVQRIQVDVSLNNPSSKVIHLPAQDVIPQFVAGYPLGQVMGIALQNLDDKKKYSVVSVEQTDDNKAMSISLLNDVTYTISSGQTRVVPILLQPSTPWFQESFDFVVRLKAHDQDNLFDVPVTIQISHRTSWSSVDRQTFTGTFLFANSTPSHFVTVPPRLKSEDKHPPILALHGAGVDVIGHDFWAQSMPDNNFSWIVIPVGRTSWGLDWHGPSADEAWDTVRGLGEALRYHREKHDCPWSYWPDLPVILVGHSNGGQGTWYIASRYPDRIRAAIPAAGYIKSQAYVPLTLSRSGHFIDPSLRAILESSLTPDDNDLHLSNLVDTPLLAIHGGDDRNVPSWHSRELMSTMHSWEFAGVKKIYHEDFGQDHWYPTVLNNDHVQGFVDQYTLRGGANAELDDTFTLTTLAPHQSGSLRGWRIVELITPGRLGRLTVKRIPSRGSNTTESYTVYTSNIRQFSPPSSLARNVVITVDDIAVSNDAWSDNASILMLHLDDRLGRHWKWKVNEPIPFRMILADAELSQICIDQSSKPAASNPPGRVQAILSSPGPITIVTTTVDDARESSIASRLAYVLQLYHRIDSEIISQEEAANRTQQDTWLAGNVVLIGTPRSTYIQKLLEDQRTPVGFTRDGAGFTVRSNWPNKFDKDDHAIIFTHPHPTRNDSLMLCLLYHTPIGLERAARLFPYRTGIAVPDWAIVSNKMDTMGAGGILAAGVWGNNWSFNEPMSWMY